MGDKPERLLERLAAGRREHGAISSLKYVDGRNHHETKSLVEVMTRFVKKLYASEFASPRQAISNFLDKMNLLSLSEADRATLGRFISEEEIIKVINTLQNGNAPGPDG